MNIPHVQGEVAETPLVSFSSKQDALAALMFLVSVYFLFVEQNLVFFAGSFMVLAFIYRPHQLSISGRYIASTDVIT